ncbi:unnamed protein product [Spirodela intermedia]|uniref:BHLH domain-containing protein n=1 Tax=Spirodela intermedia TaxID=51605 RepID=A0A7I8L2F1_SPIIN|nr:unnamed protein product [Spirodela intermedia]
MWGRSGAFMEPIGGAEFGGVDELLGMEGEEGGVDGGCLPRCLPPFTPPSSSPSPMAFLQRGDEGFPKNGEGSTSSSSFSSGNSILSKANISLCTAARKMKAGKKRRREEQRRGSPSRRWSSKVQIEYPHVKKEKLGQRIGELQRLVSPFGKSDTASVLHEALGYIRFLHDQVQVLSSPYLQRQPSSAHPHGGDGGGMAVGLAQDLRSRGLCLVPLAYTSHLVANNGADFWSPAMGCGGGDDDHRLNAYKL